MTQRASASVQVEAVTDMSKLVRLWPGMEHYVERACIRGHLLYEPVDVLAMALRGEVLVWIAHAVDDIENGEHVVAILVTKVNDYPRRRVCEIPFAAGDHMESWLDQFIEKSEANARECGCQAMMIVGRKGWIRAAGYEEAATMMMKELE